MFQISSSPSPTGSVESTTAGVGSDVIWWILLFGFAALLCLVIIQVHRNSGRKKKILTPVFGRVFGLTVIATLAAALTLANVATADKSGAFTLFGTIAGYLAAGVGTGSAKASGGTPKPAAPGTPGASGTTDAPEGGAPEGEAPEEQQVPITQFQQDDPTYQTGGRGVQLTAEEDDSPDPEELTDRL